MALNKFLPLFTLLALLFLYSCDSNTAMTTPLSFKNSSEFKEQIVNLEKVVAKEDFLKLTTAIGNLQVFDTTHFTLEEFHQSLNDLTPNQIIEKSKQFD